MKTNKFKHAIETFVRQHRAYLLLFLIGLLIRLAIMPYFSHVDLFSEYRRVYKTIELGSYFPDLKRLIVYYIELFFLKLSLPFISDAAATFYFSDLAQSTADLESYFLFINHNNIHRILFLFKIPYLLFDIGTFLLLYKMIKEHPKRIWALGIWWFNPITIFAFYLFGRYESIPLFFIMLTIFLLQRKKILFSAIALGFAVNSREINIIYLPLYLLSIARPMVNTALWRHVLKKLLPAAVILLCFYILPIMAQKLMLIETVSFGGMDGTGMHPARRMFSMQYQWVVPFFFIYSLICYWLMRSCRSSDEIFFYAATFCILSFLIFIDHSAHYVSWATIYMAASLYYSREIIFPFICFCIAWILLWLFMTDAGVFTLFLATPLSPNFFGIKRIPQLYVERFGADAVIDLNSMIWILRNVYAAMLVVIFYTLLKTLKARTNAS